MALSFPDPKEYMTEAAESLPRNKTCGLLRPGQATELTREDAHNTACSVAACTHFLMKLQCRAGRMHPNKRGHYLPYVQDDHIVMLDKKETVTQAGPHQSS